MKTFSTSSKKQILLGLLLIVASFFYLYLPFTIVPLAASHACFLIGNILFFNAVSHYFNGPHMGRKHIPGLLLLGFILTLFTELYIHWWGKFWFYTYLSLDSYVFVGIPLLTIYMIYLLATYFGALSALRYVGKSIKLRSPSQQRLKSSMQIIGVVSLIAVVVSTIVLAVEFTKPTLEQFLSIDYAPMNVSLLFLIVAVACIALCFLFEYFAYRRNGTAPVLGPIVSGDYVPLLAIFLAGWVSALIYEGFNAPSGWWRYANIPYADIQLFGVPILVFILWPLQYLPIISLYSLLKKRRAI